MELDYSNLVSLIGAAVGGSNQKEAERILSTWEIKQNYHFSLLVKKNTNTI
jgi:hypothetical protein